MLALLAAHEIAFAQPPARLPCAYDDKACAEKNLRGRVVQKLVFWAPALARPLEQRIGAAPPELVEFITLENVAKGYPERPRAAAPAPDFLQDLRAAIAELPHEVTRLIEGKLAGIYFVEDLGGTGYTDQLFDESKAVAGFVVLDASVLGTRTANAWATWKENTPFKARPGFTLAATIEPASQDNRANAIQYILLHEFGHVLAIGGNVHPSWNDDARDVRSTAQYPYFNLSWMISGDGRRYDTLFRDSFVRRSDVVYYFGAKLSAGRMTGIYDSLENSSFASLYAATNPFDDFAEAFVTYVHTVLMGKPFEIRIYRNERAVKTFGSCWEHVRCAEKRRFLEQMLRQAR